MSKIALKGHYHTCPQPKHVGGKVLVDDPSRPTVMGIPIAIVGDRCCCHSGMDTIKTGSKLFTYNGVPVAVTGSKTEHGGEIVEGHSYLIIE